ncbi:MAG: GNAT family N-acetyltransferase [Ferruginibacter sp.]|nr:GNAT family N-acetyltransferase [Ferruginibacter sp.]
MNFSNPNITIATLQNVEAITALLNSAYRGETSKQGWTHEADLIAGEVRTSKESLQKVMLQPKSVILKFTDENNVIVGCVNLQQHDAKIYLGMLSVSPLLQNAGIGKQLLAAADEYALQQNCSTIYMTVITHRTELISWYKRHGYVDTGKTEPFIENEETGKQLTKLEFMVLEKNISSE